ncbi:MAG: efflux RND transporter periplasmic adaptor subunit [Nitrospinae bacterium]|nr:efflux RND transporter periplasmic adaptor subunit [Nitrospinota bacterium]
MDPTYIRDKPGKSPMLMDLVPVYEDEMEDGGIRINPTITQNIGVKTEKVKFRKLTRTIRTIGRLTYDERKVTHIHTKYEGWIEKLHVDFTGQKVAKDDLLMEIYSPELVSTQEELLLALKYSESFKENPYPEITLGADRLLKSTERKLRLFDVPEHQIETLKRTKKISKTMHIHSPVKGFVIHKTALQGMYIKPGMSLYTIVDLSNIWVLADIYEYELPWVKIGQPVKMELPYYPGKEFRGKVTYIDPFLEAKTRTIKVRMEFENINWELKPEMYSNVILESVIAKNSVAVPEESVIHSGEKDLVVIVNKSGGFESREVTLGAAADGYYQVLKGLKGGEEVVTSSHFLLDSESSLKEGFLKLEETPEKPMDDEKMPMMEMKPLQEMKSIPGMEQNNMDMKMGGESSIILKEDTHRR